MSSFSHLCLQSGLGAYSFIIFACICLATLIYIWVVIPETKNKTFLETSQLFAHRNKVDIVAEAEIKETGGESGEEEIKNTFLWMDKGSFTQDMFLCLSAMLWTVLMHFIFQRMPGCWKQGKVIYFNIKILCLFIVICIWGIDIYEFSRKEKHVLKIRFKMHVPSSCIHIIFIWFWNTFIQSSTKDFI